MKVNRNRKGLHHRNPRRTEKKAAEDITGATGTWRRRVFEELALSDGSTDDRLFRVLKGNPNTIRPRRVELMDWGLIHDSGRTGTTRSDKGAIIWELTAEGWKHI